MTGLIPGAATLAGTERFRNRCANTCNPRHFREAFGLVLSTIGIGTARGKPDGATDRQITSAIRRSIRSGINVIDTASNYRDGGSERAVGHALRTSLEHGEALRDELLVASKGGYLPFAPGLSLDYATAYLRSIDCCSAIPEVVAGCHSIHPEFLAYELTRTRAHLGVETLDLYYVHNPEVQLRNVGWKEFRERLFRTFVFLEKMCEAGSIQRYGIATWHGLRVSAGHPLYLDLEQIRKLAHDSAATGCDHFAVVQAPLNPLMPELLITTRPSRGRELPVIECANELGLGVIVSAAIAQGKPIGSARTALGEILWHSGESDAQRSLQFGRSIPQVGSCLVGMKRPEHVTEMLAMTTRPPLLPQELLASLTTPSCKLEST